jgi:hypothetical protein
MSVGLINSALHHLGERGKGSGREHVGLKGIFNQHGHGGKGHHVKMFDSESSECSEYSKFAANFKPNQVDKLVEIFYELLF